MKQNTVAALLAAVLISTLAAAGAKAQSGSAKSIIQAQIREACGASGGRMQKGGAITRDLTGDGKADLLIDHDRIACRGGGRSGFCGMQICSVYIYVNRNGRLTKSLDTLGGGVTIGKGKRPSISMHAHGGKSRRIRWDGKRFR
jgi:hypothetical protein